MEKKLRDAKYYKNLALKVIENKQMCTQDQFVKLVHVVDSELGYPQSTAPKQIIDKFMLIFKGYVESVPVERDRSERGRGVRKTTTLYSLNCGADKIDSILSNKPQEVMRKDQLLLLYEVFEKSQRSKNHIIDDYSWLKERKIDKNKLKTWQERLSKLYRIHVIFQPVEVYWGGSWSLRVDMSREARDSFNSLLKKEGFKEQLPVVNSQPQKVSTQKQVINNDYVAFIIGGLIMVNNGKAVEALQVGNVLRNNSYNQIEVSESDVLRIANSYPEYFERNNFGKRINFVGKKDETWEKLSEKSPCNKTWKIAWCINSGLDIKEVQDLFPKSYVEHEEINQGSKIFIVVADKGLNAFRKLSRLQLKMRAVDFPIGMDQNFLSSLKKEDKRLENIMLGKEKLSAADRTLELIEDLH
jgi:hypothetical protein